VVRSVALATGLLAVLAPSLGYAQANIDQDMSPASIYQSDCAVCHKSVRGLANGRGHGALADFLAEHYTSNQQEATALAAYVLAGGGGSGTPAPVRGANAEPDHAAPGEGPQTHDARRPVKPEEEPATAGARLPRHQAGKPAKPERTATVEPGSAPAAVPGSAHGERKPADRHGSAAVPQHGRLRHVDVPQHVEVPPPPPPSPEPAHVAAAPKPVAPSTPDVSSPDVSPAAAPSSTPPPESPPTEASPSSRDNIPD
jgi:hypothetical protein